MKTKNTLENKNIEKQGTATPRLMLRLLALALIMIVGCRLAIGQASFNGYYRLRNINNGGGYYMCPATSE